MVFQGAAVARIDCASAISPAQTARWRKRLSTFGGGQGGRAKGALLDDTPDEPHCSSHGSCADCYHCCICTHILLLLVWWSEQRLAAVACSQGKSRQGLTGRLLTLSRQPASLERVPPYSIRSTAQRNTQQQAGGRWERSKKKWSK